MPMPLARVPDLDDASAPAKNPPAPRTDNVGPVLVDRYPVAAGIRPAPTPPCDARAAAGVPSATRCRRQRKPEWSRRRRLRGDRSTAVAVLAAQRRSRLETSPDKTALRLDRTR